MVRSVLGFDVEPHRSVSSKLEGDSRARRAWRRDVSGALEPFAAARGSAHDYEVDLDSAELGQLVAGLKQLRKDKVAVITSGELREWLVDDDEAPIEWFALEPKAEFDEWGPTTIEAVPSVKADQIRAKSHVAGGKAYASERFKAFVGKRRFTGIEFVWVADSGRHQAMQWYIPLAQEPLGRGLDHPWFDPKKLRRDCEFEPREPAWRHGAHAYFWSQQFRPGAGFGEPLKDELLSMLPKRHGLMVVSYRRVLRRYLPDTDFAFMWEQPEEWHPDWGKKPCLLHSRCLCVNRKTKQALAKAGLVAEEECVGIAVLDRAYKGAEVLDRLPGGPGPLFSGELLARIREQEAEAWAAFAAKPKPPRERDVTRALKAVKARKKKGRVELGRPASPAAIRKANDALPFPIPPAWQQLLRASNGAVIRECVLTEGQAGSALAEAEELVEFQEDSAWLAEELDPDLSKRLLWVGLTEFGDFVALDTGTQTESGDCHVLLVNHETMAVERQWDSVAAFLEEVLAEQE